MGRLGEAAGESGLPAFASLRSLAQLDFHPLPRIGQLGVLPAQAGQRPVQSGRLRFGGLPGGFHLGKAAGDLLRFALAGTGRGELVPGGIQLLRQRGQAGRGLGGAGGRLLEFFVFRLEPGQTLAQRLHVGIGGGEPAGQLVAVLLERADGGGGRRGGELLAELAAFGLENNDVLRALAKGGLGLRGVLFGGRGRGFRAVRLLPGGSDLLAEFRFVRVEGGELLFQRRGAILGRRGSRWWRFTHGGSGLRRCGGRARRRSRAQGNDGGSGGAPFVQPDFSGLELAGGHFTHEHAKCLAGGAVFGGKAEPDVGFDGILRDHPALGIKEPEVVLGDGVALLRLGANGREVGIGRAEGGTQHEKNRHQGAGHGADKQAWFHGEAGKPAAMLRFFAGVAIKDRRDRQRETPQTNRPGSRSSGRDARSAG